MPDVGVRGTVPARLAAVCFWLALAAICLNALLFAVKAANPLVMADGWHFLDAIVKPYAHGELAPGDLFLKRSAMDHSQPLRKLILLMHYEWFDLDYSVEAVIGACTGILNLLLLVVLVRVARGARPPSAAERVGLLALAAAYLSLNASIVFSWPLLTLNYTSHLFLLVHFAAAWWAFQEGRWRRVALVAATAFLLGIVADDTGTIAAIALAMVALLHGWRSGAWRRALGVAGAAGAGQLAYLAVYRWVAPPVGGGAMSPVDLFPELLARVDDAWQWLAIPLSASVAHRSQLHAWAAESAGWLPDAIAVVLLVAHAWFWWKAVAGRWNAAAFVATCQMLLFYGLLAGMLLARVSQHGSDYLWQPRYVLIYRWNLVALLLMALAQLAGDPRHRLPRRQAAARLAPGAVVVVATLVLALQVPLSLRSWDALPFAKRFQQRQAMQMRQLAADPAQVPVRCAPTLVICRQPPARRAELMHFLRDQRLSVFADDFDERHPRLARTPRH